MSALLKTRTQDITKASEHYVFLHNQNLATAILWTKSREGHDWHKINNKNVTVDFLDSFNAEFDVFLTPNQFYGWRRFDLLKSLRACFVDIDREMLRYELDQLIYDSQMPLPSLVVSSGRGWHLYWLLEHTTKQWLGRWQEVQDKLIKAFDADPAARDCARVLRLAGTVNSKNGALVTAHVRDRTPWVFDDLCYEVLGYEVYPKPKAKVLDIQIKRAETTHRVRTSSQSGIHGWWYRVYQDLYIIAQSYKKGGIPE